MIKPKAKKDVIEEIRSRTNTKKKLTAVIEKRGRAYSDIKKRSRRIDREQRAKDKAVERERGRQSEDG